MADLAPEIVERLQNFPRVAVPDGGTAAAVALVLLDDPDKGLCFLLTRRPSTLPEHPGQFALPGGRVDEGEGLLDAALRELDEEMGLLLPPESVVGYLDDFVTRSGYVITPVVVWAGRLTKELTPSPIEIAETHIIPLTDLDVDPIFTTIPESDRPVIQLPLWTNNVVFAPTGAILYQFREVCLQGRTTRVDHFEQPVFAWR